MFKPTFDELKAAVEESLFGMGNLGWCRACGTEVGSGIEPDARRYPCEACGEKQVYAAEEFLISGWYSE